MLGAGIESQFFFFFLTLLINYYVALSLFSFPSLYTIKKDEFLLNLFSISSVLLSYFTVDHVLPPVRFFFFPSLTWLLL